MSLCCPIYINNTVQRGVDHTGLILVGEKAFGNVQSFFQETTKTRTGAIMARLNSMPQLHLRGQLTISDHVIALAWGSDSTQVAAASVSGPISLINVNTSEPLHVLSGHQFGTTALAWHPKKPMLASAGQDGRVRLWNTTTGEQTHELSGGSAWVEHVAWSPKGDFLVSAAGKRLKCWDITGQLVQEYPPFSSTISGIAWSAKGKEFAISGYGQIAFYQPGEAQATRVFEWKGSILGIAWSPDTKMIAGGGQDATVHFWYTKTGDDLQMSGYPNKITSVSWNASSQYLATNGGEIAAVWDCEGDGPTGRTPILLERHNQSINQVQFQHRGLLLASGGEDGIVALWFPGGSKRVLAESEIGEPVSTLAWSPGDGRLAVGGANGFVGIYSV
jgi:WD40 repeat protein